MSMPRTPLARTEEAVQMALDEVKQQRVRFRSASAAKMQEQRDKLDGRTPPRRMAVRSDAAGQP